jgi:hypothetical protein
MKKILVLFMFIFGLTFCTGYGSPLHFSIPLPGQVIQSGNNMFIPGIASIEFCMFLDSGYGNASNWQTQITYPDGHQSAWQLGQWGYMSSGNCWNVTKAGTYTIYGKVYCSDLGGHFSWQPASVSFSVQDQNPPTKPANLQVAKNSNNHPQLTWTANVQLDLSTYKIYKMVTAEEGWQYLASTTSTSYQDASESYPKPGGIGLTHPVNYKITAVDINTNESIPSDIVTAYVAGALENKKAALVTHSVPNEYSLQQNYPNPFNPSTTIQYSITEPGLVKLELYDVLGNKIRDLVNEFREMGAYNVVLNASNLPSGIYFYKISVNNYVAIQKMSLLK